MIPPRPPTSHRRRERQDDRKRKTERKRSAHATGVTVLGVGLLGTSSTITTEATCSGIEASFGEGVDSRQLTGGIICDGDHEMGDSRDFALLISIYI